MAAYRKVTDGITTADSTVVFQRASDGAFIPADSRNADYIALLAWIAVPNTLDAAL